MGAMTLDLEGWRKSASTGELTPVHNIHLQVTEACHLMLEQAVEELQQRHEEERLLDIDPEALEVEVSADCGPLASCQLRVYRKPGDEDCHFHLVGNCKGDNSLVYSNAVLVNMLT